jgi:hypothetical protein
MSSNSIFPISKQSIIVNPSSRLIIKLPVNTFDSGITGGDVIRFDKKNKKSIVVTFLNKSEHKIANGVRSSDISNPNWIFRIYIDSLYQFMLRSPDFKSRFDAYVRRKESLDLLGI